MVTRIGASAALSAPVSQVRDLSLALQKAKRAADRQNQLAQTSAAEGEDSYSSLLQLSERFFSALEKGDPAGIEALGSRLSALRGRIESDVSNGKNAGSSGAGQVILRLCEPSAVAMREQLEQTDSIRSLNADLPVFPFLLLVNSQCVQKYSRDLPYTRCLSINQKWNPELPAHFLASLFADLKEHAQFIFE